MGIGQGQPVYVRSALMRLVEQVQVIVGAVIDEPWFELPPRHIPLEMSVVDQVFRGMLGQVGVDVL
ncbi:hypothetical protein D3C77_635270 [compost metagenome]